MKIKFHRTIIPLVRYSRPRMKIHFYPRAPIPQADIGVVLGKKLRIYGVHIERRLAGKL